MKSKWTFVGSIVAFLLLSLIIAVALTAPQSARANPGVLYAAPTAQGSGNCSSWADACTLQTALTNAVSGDEIWVKEGVHYPGTTRTAAFALKNGVAIYGGFAGTETQRNERNWQTHRTILSGDIDQNDITDGGVVTTTANITGTNAYHVISSTNVISTAVLDGFFITAGQANGSYPHNCGGGVFNQNSSLTLTDVTFSGNSAESGGGMYNAEGINASLTNVTFRGNSARYGGGLYNDVSGVLTLANATFSGNSATNVGGGMYNAGTATLTNVTFSGNTANWGGGMSKLSRPVTLNHVTFSGNSANDKGGGMYLDGDLGSALTDVTFSGNSANYGGGMYNNDHSSPTLTNITFSINSAPAEGGGMYNNYSNPKLTGTAFVSNMAGRGGGMYNYNNSSPTLTCTTFISNTATNYGGGMFNKSYSNPTLTNVTFIRNTAGNAGGMFNESYSNPTLMNVIFSSNSATADGGGMYNHLSSSPTLTNVTFSGNAAGKGGGIYNNNVCTPTLVNVIVWGNNAATGPEFLNNNSTPLISYSDIRDCGGSGSGWQPACGTDGSGNIDADPRFVDAAAGNLRLQLTSPAIDAGNNAAVPAGVTTDLDGNPRFVDILTVPDTGNGTPPIVDMGAYEVPLNRAPAFTSTPVTTATQGVLYTYAITTTDPDLLYGDVLTVTAPTRPAWLTLQDHGNGTATLSGTPTDADVGDQAVVLRVTDRGGLSATQSFTITVAAKPEYTVFLPLVVRNR